MTQVEMSKAVITDEMMEGMRARAGVRLRIDHSVYNEEATRLAIIKFAGAIGDHNRLWSDGDYAAASPYGGAVAPPSWVIAAFSGIQFGWPGLGSFHCRSELAYHLPIYRDDRILAECVYEGFEGPKAASFAKRFVIDTFLNRYVNQDEQLVATIRWSVINYERGEVRERGAASSSQPAVPHPWTQEELESIEDEVLGQEPRGPVPRYWDDVAVGDELDTITKGPIGLTDEIAFVAAGGAPIPRLTAHGVALRDYRKHPAWAYRDPVTSALEPIYSVHYSQAAANAMGVPLQYDVGFQRQAWHTHLLTNWMGDAGWPKASSAEYRGFVFLADVVRLGGRVVEKRVDPDGEAVVDVETWAHNQRGDDVMPGSATVALPRRDRSGGPVHARARRRLA